MMRNLHTYVLMAVLAFASSVWAQPDEREGGRRGPGRGRGGEGWRQGGGGERGPGGGPGRRGDPGQRFERMLNRVAQDLELDEDQQAEFDTVVEEMRTQFREMRETFQAIRQAERDGDEALAEELRATLPAPPQPGQRPGNPMERIFEQIEPILREDQLERLNEMRERFRPPSAEQRLEQLSNELQLDDEQRAYVGELAEGVRQQFEGMRESWQQVRGLRQELREAEEAGDTALVEELQAQIEEARPNPGAIFDEFFDNVETVLTEEQLPLLDGVRERMTQRQQQFQQRREQWRNDRQAGQFGGPDGQGNGPPPGEGFNPDRRAGGDAAANAGDVEEVPLLDLIEETANFGSVLELDDEQQATFDEILETVRQQQASGELTEAQAAEAVYEQMRTKVLTTEQVESLGSFQAAVKAGATSRDVSARNLGYVFRALQDVKLTRTQKIELRKIQRNARTEYRKLRRDREKAAALAQTTKNEIVAILDSTQAEKFNDKLEQLQKRTTQARSRTRR